MSSTQYAFHSIRFTRSSRSTFLYSSKTSSFIALLFLLFQLLQRELYIVNREKLPQTKTKEKSLWRHDLLKILTIFINKIYRKSSNIFSINVQIEINNAVDVIRLKRRIKAVFLSIFQFFTVDDLNNENQLKKYKKKIEELEKKNKDLKKKLKIWKKWDVFEELMNSAIISFNIIIMIFSTSSPVRYVDKDIFVDDMNALRARHRRWLNDIIAADAPEDDEIRKKLPSWSKIGRWLLYY